MLKIKLKVVKFTKDRKIIEIPKSIRDNFKIGDVISILEGKPKKRKK